jgi:hypothetical protein
VKVRERQLSSFEPQIIEWCAQVTVAPEVNKRIVFNSGIFHAFNIVKKAGGHTPPIKILGLKLK